MAIRKKRSISMPPELDSAVAAAAATAEMSYSGWLAEVARKELILEDGLAAVAEFEASEGTFTEAEIAEATAWAASAVKRSALTGQQLQQSA